MCNPLVTMIIIGDYSDSSLKFPSIQSSHKDYRNIISSLNGSRGYSIAIPTSTTTVKNNKFNADPINDTTNVTHIKTGERISPADVKLLNVKCKWTVEEICNFNQTIREKYIDIKDQKKICNNLRNGYDGLIYFISCHGDGDGIIYDSCGESLALSMIYHDFNNQTCRQLRQRPKIFFCDTNKITTNSQSTSTITAPTANDDFKQEKKLDVPTLSDIDQTTVSTLQVGVTPIAKMAKHTPKATITYTKEDHFRKIFCHSMKQPIPSIMVKKNKMDNNSNMSSQSIFVQCLASVLSYNFENNYNDDNLDDSSVSQCTLTNMLFKTRKLIASRLRLPQNNPDSVVMDDYSSMPYPITFGTCSNQQEVKLNDCANQQVIQQSVCDQSVFAIYIIFTTLIFVNDV